MKKITVILVLIVVVLSLSQLSFTAMFTPSNTPAKAQQTVQAQQMNFFLTDNNQKIFN